MEFAVDLHIHSALSPCADNDMTPNNIVNMAKIKGLDIIALTDHNSGRNLTAVSVLAKKSGLAFIPGMEVETSEEVHLICLLPDLDSAAILQSCVYDSLPPINNREDIFGKQLIMDENDSIIGEEKRLLVTAAGLSSNDIFTIVNKLSGAVIPAHIDRPSYSMISNLGMIPDDLGIKYLEISAGCDKHKFLSSKPGLEKFTLIKSSDAHYLGDILERVSLMELDEPSPQALISKLRQY